MYYLKLKPHDPAITTITIFSESLANSHRVIRIQLSCFLATLILYIGSISAGRPVETNELWLINGVEPMAENVLSAMVVIMPQSSILGQLTSQIKF